MSLEDIVRKILSAKPELTLEEVLRMIEAKEKDSKGFLTRKSAALSLAIDLGVAVEKPPFRREMQIKDVVSGLSDVTVTGRVIRVFPLKRFKRPDGGEGAKRYILIADKTGTMRTTLWDDEATSDRIDLLTGKLVRFSHFSVRRGAGGKLELNAGSRGKLEVEPQDLRDEDYPPLTDFTKKINELTGDEKDANIISFIERVYPLTTFKRRDGAEGKVRRVEIKDETGKAALILWDDKVDAISEDYISKYVIISDVEARRRFDRCIELHTKNQTVITLLPFCKGNSLNFNKS